MTTEPPLSTEASVTPEVEPAVTPKKTARWWRWLKRTVLTVLATIAAYVLIILIGLLPANRNFRPTPDGIEIFVISNGVHADIVLPIQTDLHDWRTDFASDQFPSNTSTATHLAVGWGDKGFYLETPTWADLKLSNAINALFLPSPCCLHVAMMGKPALSDSCHAVRISETQYQNMIDLIRRDLKYAQNQPQWITGSAYGSRDTFYEAHGNYHALNTCNSWVGHILRQTGITVPWWTPLPKSVFLYWPEEENQDHQ